MFDAYIRFFDYLEAGNVLLRQQLGSEANQFAVILRKQPKARGPALGRQFETYLKELIRYGLKNSATESYFLEFLNTAGILQTSPRGATKIVLRPRPSVAKLSTKDVAAIRKALATATQVAAKLDAPPHYLRSDDKLMIAPVAGSEAVTRRGPGRPTKRLILGVADELPVGASKRGANDVPPRDGSFPATASAEPSREIKVTGHKLDGAQVAQFTPGEEYRLRFSVGSPAAQNLATGNTTVKDIPQGGLSTHWVVTSTNVEFVNAPSAATIAKTGATWIAEFDLLIPEAGESDTQTVAIRAAAGAANLLMTIYAVSGKTREVYREVSIKLDGAPSLLRTKRSRRPCMCISKPHTSGPPRAEHIQVSIVNGLAIVSTQKLGPVMRNVLETFSATDNLIGTAIESVRDSLEQLREAHSDYLDDLDAADLAKRLATGQWRPYSGYAGSSWSPLPAAADAAHTDAFEQVRGSAEWRALASDGYALYNRCFPKGKKLRALLEQMVPGSRVDFHWTDQSGPGFVSHVPWALMYMEEVGPSGPVPDPEKFLGLRFRIGTRSWDVDNGSVAAGGLDTTSAMDLLYWGNQAGDDVATEARWQADEYKMWKWSKLLPDPALPDPKQQLIQALDQPAPAPVSVLYFYCHCSVGNGAQPVLRFGNTSKSLDTLSRTDISQRSLPDGPLVFANACTTSQADPHMTSELEQRFFERGVRAFIGTETKVPTRLASKFAWLYFQFLYRMADPDFKPMAAGEALTQARIFLWTQYKNLGGLFYSITNQYDLYLASNEEVLALAQTKS